MTTQVRDTPHITHVAIGGSDISHGIDFKVFAVRYKDRVFEFYQQRRDGFWRVDYPLDEDFSDRIESMSFTLLFLAGFKPYKVRDDHIGWRRPDSRTLWPEGRNF